MKTTLVVTADTHAEKARVGWVAYAIFDKIAEVVAKHKAALLIHGGDWFDSRGKIPTMVFNRLYNKLKEFIAKGIPVYTVVGNHDLAVSEGGVEESSLYVLAEELSNFFVGSPSEPLVVEVSPGVFLYLIGYSSSVNLEELVREISLSDPKAINIAVLHQVTLGSESSTGYVFGEGIDAELLSHKFTFSILGDIHKPQLVLDNVLVPGAPYAMDFGDTGDRGCWVLHLDTADNSVKPEFVPLESPKFLTIDFDTSEGLNQALFAVKPENFYRFKFPESLSAELGTKLLPSNVYLVPETTETEEARVDLSQPHVDVIAEYVNYACTDPALDKGKLIDIGHAILEEAGA